MLPSTQPVLKKRLGNIPNWITLGRLVLCALYVIDTSVPWPFSWSVALVIFILASITDWVDGVLARAWNMITPLGQLLDPLADKILVTAALISLIPVHVVAPWLVVAIVSREFLITGLRSLAALHKVVLSADKSGKWKTALQITAIIVALVQLAFQEWLGPNLLGTWLLIVEPYLFLLALLLTVISGGLYLIKNRTVFDV